MSWIDKLFGKKEVPTKVEEVAKSSQQQVVQSDTEIVMIEYFMEKYSLVLLSNDRFSALDDELTRILLFDNKKFAKVSKSIIKELDDALVIEEYKRNRLNKCAERNNKGIELENEGKINEAIEIYEQNISGDCYPASHSFDRLIILYHKMNDIENERRVIHKALEVLGSKSHDNYLKYQGRLNSLDNLEPVYPKNAIPFVKNGKTLGEKQIELKKQMPEFMFYSTDNEPLEFPKALYSKIMEINERYMEMLKEASYHEESNRYDLAANIYERLVGEGYTFPKPYERLIVIYKKAKLNDDVVRILEKGIDFFSKLRTEQYIYVNGLAAKYGKTEFWNERYRDGKKITYYGGAYELYNPYPCVEKFKQQLDKINSNKFK